MRTLRGYVAALLVGMVALMGLAIAVRPLLPWLFCLLVMTAIYGVLVRE